MRKQLGSRCIQICSLQDSLALRSTAMPFAFCQGSARTPRCLRCDQTPCVVCPTQHAPPNQKLDKISTLCR